MREAHTIAIVDDEPGQRQLLGNALERAGFAAVQCEDGEQALAKAPQCDLMLLDVRMPGMSGLEVLERLRNAHPGLPVILLTAYIDLRDAVAAIKQGAVDYLEKPVDLDELLVVIEETLGVDTPATSEEEAPVPPGLVAESPAMKDVVRQAYRVADTNTTVLLLGESGAGKEVVAEYIHRHSPRADAPLTPVDCTSLPEHLVESELFGHAKGAFTGAHAPRQGRFVEADGGTLFLDEVGELPPALQPKLLRVLETAKVRPVGGEEDITVNVRVVAATNRDLETEAKEGRFREDLFYRLNVFPIVVPPLRERTDDILPLAALFLKDSHKKLAPAAQRLLTAHDWPGNVRELRNALERAAILANGELILPNDLPPNVQRAPERPVPGKVLVGDMEEIQRRAILEALEKTGGNKTRAAELLGISRRNLLYKLRAYGM